MENLTEKEFRETVGKALVVLDANQARLFSAIDLLFTASGAQATQHAAAMNLLSKDLTEEERQECNKAIDNSIEALVRVIPEYTKQMDALTAYFERGGLTGNTKKDTTDERKIHVPS